MNKRIIYTTDNGGMAVLIPAPEALEKMTIEQIAAKDVPVGAAFEIVDATDIPADRTFRDAWERSGRAIMHNMVKARTIAHNKRRAARAAEFAPLDVEATIPAMAAQAEAKRQILRDKYAAMQIRIDEATTEAALRAELATLQ